jgi:hypothetical protein
MSHISNHNFVRMFLPHTFSMSCSSESHLFNYLNSTGSLCNFLKQYSLYFF